ncbi:MAG: glycosyltransferase [Chlorobium sp.]|nr:glycosyltransferase [Chlorobium sp.]
MNILFMNSARTWGGTEKWTRMAAEAIAKQHKTFLIYRREIVGERFTIPKFRLPCLSHIDLYTLIRLVQIIRKENIEVIIPTKRKDYVIAGLASRICSIKNIIRLGIVRPLKIPIIHKLIYHTLADGVIVNAEKIKTTLLETSFMQNEKIRVIYNGLDTDALDRLSLPPAHKTFRFQITTAGILTKRKGHDFLLKGFAQFIKLLPEADAGVVIIGDGPKKEELKKLAKELNITERVSFTGFLQNPYPNMAISDVIAMTSTNEGISNALLEGMYLKNVPVSTFAGGTEELINKEINGFLLDYGDESALSAILLKLYRDDKRRKEISETARETVIQKFSISSMAREVTQFCRDTIKPHRTTSNPNV